MNAHAQLLCDSLLGAMAPRPDVAPNLQKKARKEHLEAGDRSFPSDANLNTSNNWPFLRNRTEHSLVARIRNPQQRGRRSIWRSTWKKIVAFYVICLDNGVSVEISRK